MSNPATVVSSPVIKSTPIISVSPRLGATAGEGNARALPHWGQRAALLRLGALARLALAHLLSNVNVLAHQEGKAQHQ